MLVKQKALRRVIRNWNEVKTGLRSTVKELSRVLEEC